MSSLPPSSDLHEDPVRQQNERLRLLLDGIRRSPFYRLLVRTGRWRRTESKLSEELAKQLAGPPEDRTEAQGPPLAIDLTGLQPGAANGGAKIGALALVEAMIETHPDRRFVLFHRQGMADELAHLQSANSSCREISLNPAAFAAEVTAGGLGALYCPMTCPPWFDPRIPTVSHLHDLQHESLPQFFTPEEISARRASVRRAARCSDHLLVPSQFARQEIISQLGVRPQSVDAVPWQLARRLRDRRLDDPGPTLERLGLMHHPYLLYPANFWPHKNHRLLLAAFSRLVRDHADQDLRLVLTGSADPSPDPVLGWARQLGLESSVHYLGFLPELEFSHVLAKAKALVFPSLHEGFGIPIVEAMAAEVPVLCSNVGALPEVSAGAALEVDPRNVGDLFRALRRICFDDATRQKLIERGRLRAQSFSDVHAQARQVMDLIDRTRLGRRRRWRSALVGCWPDRWTSDALWIIHGTQGRAELGVTNPSDRAVTVTGTNGVSRELAPRSRNQLTFECTDDQGVLELSVHPTWRRSEEDDRRLGLLVDSAELIATEEIDLLAFDLPEP